MKQGEFIQSILILVAIFFIVALSPVYADNDSLLSSKATECVKSFHGPNCEQCIIGTDTACDTLEVYGDLDVTGVITGGFGGFTAWEVAYADLTGALTGSSPLYYSPSTTTLYLENIIAEVAGTETLTEVDFTTHANWNSLPDFDDTGGYGEYIHSVGGGTLQNGTLAIAAVSDAVYRFDYTISNYSGDVELVITNSFPAVQQTLAKVDGNYTLYFTSNVAAIVEFRIEGTSTNGGLRIDDLSLKQVTGGGTIDTGDTTIRFGVDDYLEMSQANAGTFTYDITTDGTPLHLFNDNLEVVGIAETDGILSAGNVVVDDGSSHSPETQWIGGSNDDTGIRYLLDDAVAGQSDIVDKLCDNAGNSEYAIHDVNDNEVFSVDSNGGVTGVSYIIGANTLDTNEWAFLDGQNQTVASTSSPTFVVVTSGSFVIAANTLDTNEWAFLDGINQSVGTGDSVTHVNFLATGTITGRTVITDTGVERVLTSAEMGGGMVVVTAAVEVRVPDVCDSATGAMVMIVQGDVSEVVEIAVTDTNDHFFLDGADLGANFEIDSPGDAIEDNFICLVCRKANEWHSYGRSGVWIDGGAAD